MPLCSFNAAITKALISTKQLFRLLIQEGHLEEDQTVPEFPGVLYITGVFLSLKSPVSLSIQYMKTYIPSHKLLVASAADGI